MKSPAILLYLIAVFVAACGTQTKVHRASTTGDWSEIVDQMRGRLIVEPVRDDTGSSGATLYLELQNLASTPQLRKLVFTRGNDCFTWQLTDAGKQVIPRWQGGVPWIYDYGQMMYPISLPARASLRVPVSSATYHILLPKLPDQYDLPRSSLVFKQDAPNAPWHLISGSSTEGYFLSATFESARPSDAHKDSFWWEGRLLLPAVQLPNDPSPRREIW